MDIDGTVVADLQTICYDYEFELNGTCRPIAGESRPCDDHWFVFKEEAGMS